MKSLNNMLNAQIGEEGDSSIQTTEQQHQVPRGKILMCNNRGLVRAHVHRTVLIIEGVENRSILSDSPDVENSVCSLKPGESCAEKWHVKG